MSVERIQRKSGAVWRVRWRENGQPHSRVMGSKRDAELFEGEIKRRKRLGQLAQIDAGRQTVAEFAREWWRMHAEPNLAARTRESYAVVLTSTSFPASAGCRCAMSHPPSSPASAPISRQPASGPQRRAGP